MDFVFVSTGCLNITLGVDAQLVIKNTEKIEICFNEDSFIEK
tara:strand:+ start:21 stop:146 length:126 start_codon:yes stop_codon:yes gene_type:complete